ncbi:SGNH hydrolase-type esterase domain-containing protein [Artemisia annua]|uniref:SGNH hydrolase-type esterase domain-containing protein n=1 Tax=Artemisia annua TaxID=35608 RepID=A0A2U1MCJ0_ARTAN|nr:SGNH hydrolase-type esterase domain-containing protein [Artemisia annua]
MAISLTFIPMISLFVMLMTCTLHANGCYTSIISFGDSLADTGNLKRSVYRSKSDPPHFLFLPYGETFFHEATGRCSNGRLIIDFIGESLGKLRISPFEKMMQTNNLKDIGQGVNFAVVGATALDSSFHQARGVYNPYTNASLGVQLNCFKKMLASICEPVSKDCKSLLQNSLILMGEIGGNDYNHPIIAGKPFDELKSYVPLIINTIATAINDMIELGAKTLVVPGNLPIGCSTTYLTIYYGSDKEEYDSTTGCLTKLNKFAEFHNEMLQTALHQIREIHPDVNVIYADYYNAAMQFYRSPQQYGFTNGALKACCGGKGPYNYNLQVACGDLSSTTCDDPDTYVNWDGLHLTEAAYRVIYKSLFQGTYTTPQYNSLCPTSTLQSREASSSLAQSS